jgi:streptogramin lyase
VGEVGTCGRARKTRAEVSVESLEGRELLSGVISDIGVAPTSVTVGPMTVTDDGKLWFTETGGSHGPQIGKLTASGARTELGLPASDAGGSFGGLATDKLGNVLYTLDTPFSGDFVSGPAGKLGIVTFYDTITEYPLPTAQDAPGSATYGKDGNYWVALSNPSTGASIAKVTSAGAVTEYAVAGATHLNWLTSGPDGNIWFTDGGKIGKMTTAGKITEYTIIDASTGAPADLSNAQLTPGSDGNIWFLGLGGINSITPSGTVKNVPAQDARITALSAGTDGNLWFSFLPAAGSPLASTPGAVVGRLTTDGVTTLMPDRVDALGTRVVGEAAGLDASIWLNEGGTKFGRINLAGVPTFTPPIITPTTQSAVMTDVDKTFTGTIASFTANYTPSTASDFTTSIDWGDGHVSPGAVAPNASGGYDVIGSNTFDLPTGAVRKATITVVGPYGAAAQIFGVVTVVGIDTPGPWHPFPAGPGNHTTPPTPPTPPSLTPPTQAPTTSPPTTSTTKPLTTATSPSTSTRTLPATPIPVHVTVTTTSPVTPTPISTTTTTAGRHRLVHVHRLVKPHAQVHPHGPFARIPHPAKRKHRLY